MLFDYQPRGSVIGNSTYMHFASEILRSVAVWTEDRLARVTRSRL
jgi:hypothetical protein